MSERAKTVVEVTVVVLSLLGYFGALYLFGS